MLCTERNLWFSMGHEWRFWECNSLQEWWGQYWDSGFGGEAEEGAREREGQGRRGKIMSDE